MSMELVTETMAVLLPFLGAAGADAAKDVAKDAIEGGGRRLVDWLRKHLPGGGAVLDEVEAKPQSEARQASLRGQLAVLLEDRPTLADELRALLPAAKVSADTMIQTVGDNSQGVQFKGSGNTITIGKG